MLPPISDTEQQALDAGDIWWDAELLSGKPKWEKFIEPGKPSFSDEEQRFIDGPVAELCSMIDD